jgi:hypothetical protein
MWIIQVHSYINVDYLKLLLGHCTFFILIYFTLGYFFIILNILH